MLASWVAHEPLMHVLQVLTLALAANDNDAGVAVNKPVFAMISLRACIVVSSLLCVGIESCFGCRGSVGFGRPGGAISPRLLGPDDDIRALCAVTFELFTGLDIFQLLLERLKVKDEDEDPLWRVCTSPAATYILCHVRKLPFLNSSAWWI